MIDTNANLKIIEERFGTDHKIVGDQVWYKCPFCLKRRGKADNDYKFTINKISGKAYCFKCHVKLRLKDDLLKESVSSVYGELLDIFSDYKKAEDEDEYNMFYVPTMEIKKGTAAYSYCAERGLTEDKIAYYNLKLGVNENGGRIIVPNEYVNGWCDIYQARSYTNQTPKYKNPYGVDKSKIVFNLHRIKENADRIYICEGAITAICAGKEAVGVYGCHPSENQISQLVEKHAKEYVCTLDNDSAGRPGNEQLAKTLTYKCPWAKVYICYMPEGKDAADIGESAYKEYVEKNKIEYNGKLNKLFLP